ncbi:MAG: polyprenyl synthetase family protein [Opitutae bacterium]|nr:polyprenyl synthetase family protein [Opitutae bacterium]
MNFTQKLKQWQDLINQSLDQCLPDSETRPARLHQAMRHSMQAGGKRLRPILVLAAHELFPSPIDPIPAALAVECIHTYSLIHDDLPAMDDSDLRRGQPTCHKAFDEATAILAGDALQPLAFEIIARGYSGEPLLALELVSILSSTAGSERLVGGQMQDLLSEGTKPSEETLSYIHANKTAAMIQASLLLGFKIGSKGSDPATIELMAQAGESLGLAFQAVDDLLDVTRSSEELGKDASHDQAAGKVTWVNHVGLDKARMLASGHTERAARFVEEIGGENTFLLELLSHMLKRGT